MTKEEYLNIKKQIIILGWEDDIIWSESLKPCKTAWTFWREFAFVICNSGMKWEIGSSIFRKIVAAYNAGQNVFDVFGHEGKAAAIHEVYLRKQKYFDEYKRSTNKIKHLEKLPWIGPITKFHLAKNLGVDCCKPDRHLVRLAAKHKMTPFELCKKLSKETGDRVATVDVVLWRAAALKLI